VRALGLIGVVVLAAGCTVAPRLPPPPDWPARQAELLALESWRMTGRVAVVADGKGASASLDWRQDGATSDLALRGPFGAGGLRVLLLADSLVIEDGRGGRLAGVAARSFLAEQLGTELPLSALRYWLLGTPAPGEPASETLGEDGRLAAFEQSGWQVDLPRYEAFGADVLPVRLTASRGDVRVKLAVGAWEIGS